MVISKQHKVKLALRRKKAKEMRRKAKAYDTFKEALKGIVKQADRPDRWAGAWHIQIVSIAKHALKGGK
jgi:hypothetical protein